MIIDEITPYLGSWQLENISRLGPDEWQVIVSDSGEIYRGTGETIEQAIADCEGHFVGTLFATAFEERHKPAKDMNAVLALLGPSKRTVIARRF